MRLESRSSMKRNCCECSVEAVSYSDARPLIGHARDGRTSPFHEADFSTGFSLRKAPDSEGLSVVANTLKTRANIGVTGTLVAKGKALKSALWKRRTKDYRTQPVGGSSSRANAGSLFGWLGSSSCSLFPSRVRRSIRVLCRVKSSSSRAPVSRRKRS